MSTVSNLMFKLASFSRRRALVLTLGAIAVMAPALALAAQPIHSAHFSGRGTDCYNNTANGSYTDCQGKTKLSFRTSADGKDILHFLGYYTFYCGSGTAYVDDRKIPVSSTGSFDVSGKYASYGPNHKRNGTVHAFIKGRFIDGGHKADVTYRAAYYFFGVPPHTRPCGTQVKGVAKAH